MNTDLNNLQQIKLISNTNDSTDYKPKSTDNALSSPGVHVIEQPKDNYDFNERLSFVPNLDAAKEAEKNKIEKHLIESQSIIKNLSEEYYTDPKTGDRIANANKDKIWFANNILIILVSGAIYDENDKMIAQRIMNYFNVHESEYLGCAAKVYEYKTDIIKTLEKAAALQHGNYHLCIFIINYADKEALKDAPERLFKKRGLCEALYEEIKIRDEMIRLMGTYGFTKFTPYQIHKSEKIGPRDTQTATDIKLQYTSEIDYDSPINRELFGNLKTENTIIGQRTRIKGSANGLRTGPKMYKSINTPDRTNAELVKRIDDDDYITFNYPTEIKGASEKMRDFTENRLSDRDNNIYYQTGNTYEELLHGSQGTTEITTDKYSNRYSFSMFDDTREEMQKPTGYNSMFSSVGSDGQGIRGQKRR